MQVVKRFGVFASTMGLLFLSGCTSLGTFQQRLTALNTALQTALATLAVTAAIMLVFYWIFYAIAFGIQGVWPDPWNSVSNTTKTAIWITVGMVVALPLLYLWAQSYSISGGV